MSGKMEIQNNTEIQLPLAFYRQDCLAKHVAFVDGQPGCGKTLFSSIIAAFDRVELLQYSPEIENISTLHYLGAIADDAASTFIRTQCDLMLYETMMSRNTNFRLSDLSSVFGDTSLYRYFKRLFTRGDEHIPKKIHNEKPILHIATHNLLPKLPVLGGDLSDKLVVIEVVRHPLYMLKQQALNFKNRVDHNRQFHIERVLTQNSTIPWYVSESDQFHQFNDVEKAIFSMQRLSQLYEKRANENGSLLQVVTIPFELFVLDPLQYIDKMCSLLNTQKSKRLKKMMVKHKVPRKKIADGINRRIYRRCGWVPAKNIKERDELVIRRQFAIDHGASEEMMQVLDSLCLRYENKYLDNHKHLCLFN